MNPLLELHRLGQRVWLDNLSRTLLREGVLEKLIRDDGVAGVTSNPSIFFKAISESPWYRDDRAALARDASLTPEARYERLAVPDIQAACDLLRPLFERTGGDDGYVSLEVSPALAHDRAGTVATALRLKAAVSRDNLLVKVPATPAGVGAVEDLIGRGVSVNVTLMFSLAHVRAIANAYVSGLARFVAQGGDARRVKSVSSLFLSRVDTVVDKRLDALGGDALALRGRAAIALARLAYEEYKAIFRGDAFATLKARGARPQHLLWASTGTKNPAYRDVLYVEPLIGPETVNTMPDATLGAFRDHGTAAATLETGTDAARRDFEAIARLGIDMQRIGEELQVDGLKLFQQAFDQLLELMAPAPAHAAAANP